MTVPGEELLTDPDLWHELKSIWFAEMEAPARDIFRAGVEAAKTLPIKTPTHRKVKEIVTWLTFGRKAEPDPEAIDPAAEAVFQTYMNDWWAGLEKTTQDGLRSALLDAAETGTGTPGVVDAIGPLFGDARAQVIGVTETTRLFGQGAVATYRATGLGSWVWQTSEDDRVCDECDALDGSVHDVDEDFNPEHPNCRCFPLPVAEDVDASGLPEIGGASADVYPKGTKYLNINEELTPVVEPAFSGKQILTHHRMTKDQKGKIGEKVVAKYLKQYEGVDSVKAGPGVNNYPYDLAVKSTHPARAIEVKAGSVDNSEGAMRWRATEGEPGDEEKAMKKGLTASELKVYNAGKKVRIIERKIGAQAELAAETGTDATGETIATLFDFDRQVVDIFKWDGWHTDLYYKSDGLGVNKRGAVTGPSHYVGSFAYGSAAQAKELGVGWKEAIVVEPSDGPDPEPVQAETDASGKMVWPSFVPAAVIAEVEASIDAYIDAWKADWKRAILEAKAEGK